MNNHKFISVVNLLGAGINEVYSDVDCVLSPTEPETIYIANEISVRWNNTPALTPITQNILIKSVKSTLYPDSYSDFDQIKVDEGRIYYKNPAPSTYLNEAYRLYTNQWNGYMQNFIIKANQSIPYSFAFWLASNSNFQIPFTENFKLVFSFKYLNKTYKCTLVVELDNDSYIISNKTITEVTPETLSDISDVDITTPTDGQVLKYNSTTQKWANSDNIPNAPTTDGAYVLTATVSNGTPTYSWESTT